MIKHGEVKKELKYLESFLPFSFNNQSVSIIRQYISEQEKKDKLLRLYRDYFYALPDEAKLLREDIEALEEELEEIE